MLHVVDDAVHRVGRELRVDVVVTGEPALAPAVTLARVEHLLLGGGGGAGALLGDESGGRHPSPQHAGGAQEVAPAEVARGQLRVGDVQVLGRADGRVVVVGVGVRVLVRVVVRVVVVTHRASFACSSGPSRRPGEVGRPGTSARAGTVSVLPPGNGPARHR